MDFQLELGTIDTDVTQLSESLSLFGLMKNKASSSVYVRGSLKKGKLIQGQQNWTWPIYTPQSNGNSDVNVNQAEIVSAISPSLDTNRAVEPIRGVEPLKPLASPPPSKGGGSMVLTGIFLVLGTCIAGYFYSRWRK